MSISVKVTSINTDKRQKAVLQEKFDVTINFDLMINFYIFLTGNFGVVHGISVKLVCGRFITFSNGKNVILSTFGCTNYECAGILLSNAQNKIKSRETVALSSFLDYLT